MAVDLCGSSGLIVVVAIVVVDSRFVVVLDVGTGVSPAIIVISQGNVISEVVGVLGVIVEEYSWST